MDLQKIRQEAETIATQAGEIIKRYFGNLNSDQVKSKKNARDVVTVADTKVENFLKKNLSKVLPEAGFYGEESGKENHQSDYYWIVDPIDGTKYFKQGICLFSVVIALMHKDQPIVSVIYQPLLDTRILSAAKGFGTYINQQKTTLPKGKQLSDSILYIDADGYQTLEKKESHWVNSKMMSLMQDSYRVRMFGASAIAVTWMEANFIDGFIDITGRNAVWDMAAQRLIMTELGAKEAFLDVGFAQPRYLAGFGETFEKLQDLMSRTV